MRRIHYLQLTISAFTKSLPPVQMVSQYFFKGSDDTQLQVWVSDNLKKEYEYATAIGIIEASEFIVNESYNNGNIK